jgi:two-component system, NarL family, response regulator DesR
MFADALRALLESDTRITVVGAAANGVAALELAEAEHADVALVDIAMPGIDGLETTRLLRAAQPGLKVIVISGLAGKEVEQSALDAGASAFLLKGDLHDEVAAAIVRAAAIEH